MAINLLPPQDKKELQMEAIQKKVLVILVFVLIFFLCLIAILFLLYLYIDAKIQTIDNLIVEKEKELKTAQFQEGKALIQKTNQKLSKIQTLWEEQLLIVPLLEKLSSLTPRQIYFTNLFFKKGAREVEDRSTLKKKREVFAEVNISGLALTREMLFGFKKDLENEKTFKNVFFQPSSWMKPLNAQFSLSFEFAPLLREDQQR